jgi:hypothetical protein
VTVYEKYAHDWEGRGKAESGRNMVLTALWTKFKRVPKDIEKSILAMKNPIALETWTSHAITCKTMDEFAKALN